VQGARQVRDSALGGAALIVFVAPPSMAELERRLRGRGTEDEARLRRRLDAAAAEEAAAEEGRLVDARIVNDDVGAAVSALSAAIARRAPSALAAAPDEGAKPKGPLLKPGPVESVRDYLMRTPVLGHLKEALAALAAARPSDPLGFVVQHLSEARAQRDAGSLPAVPAATSLATAL
jgi:Guanylate kinase/Dpy-30 motif